MYIGDGSDPYHNIKGWWNRSLAEDKNQSGYESPAEHLFEMLGIPRRPEDGISEVGKGYILMWNIAPAKLCTSKGLAEKFRKRMKELLALNSRSREYTNQLTIRRGPYIISSVMGESDLPESSKVHTFHGLFADMLENDYKIITEKQLKEDEITILFDFAKIEEVKYRVIGCSARVFSLEETGEGQGFTMNVKAADHINAYLRVRLPKPVISVKAQDENETPVPVDFIWDESSGTVLLSYESRNQRIRIDGIYK